MKALDRSLLEVLDPPALSILIRSILGRAEMVRIANASRVSVPGMRNRAVSLDRLSESLADKFVAEGPARRSMLKALQSAVRPLVPAYRKLTAEEIRARLTDGERIRADADFGKLLFLLIAEPPEGIGGDEIRAALALAAPAPHAKEADIAAPPPVDEELRALQREKTELSRRAADLVALVDRLRERDRRFREEIAQRKFDVNNLKLQLAKSKKERDSLEKELRALTARLDQAERRPSTAADLGEKIAASLAETRKLAGIVEKLLGRGAAAREDRGNALTAQVARVLDELKREAQGFRKEIGAERDRLVRIAEENATRLAEVVRILGTQARESHPPPRARGDLDRVGVFVDVQNMFYAARGQDSRLDFEVLLQTATRGRRLISAIAYVVEAKEIDQSGFIALLQQKRYEVKRKDLKVRSDGSFKGDWDMEIALDALERAPSLDVVVLVTGDGDFTGLVQRLKVLGPRVEVYSFPRNTAKELREAADRFVPIDKRMLIKMSRPAPAPASQPSVGREAPPKEPTRSAGS